MVQSLHFTERLWTVAAKVEAKVEAILVFTYAKKDGTLKKFIREVHVKIRYSDGMKYLGVWPLVGVVPLSHGHYREMWWTPKQKGSVRKGRKERSFGHFHIMSFHFCVCLFKALFSDSRINKYVRIVQYTIVQYNTLQYIKLRYSIEAPFVAFNVSDQSSAKVSICTV